MKKNVVLLLFLLISTFCCAGALGAAQTSESDAEVFILPGALCVIDEEAFEGTAAQYVVLPDGVMTVMERAFADMHQLKEISIPASVKCIADHTFSGSDKVTICGKAGSYAEDWANDHQIPFTRQDIQPAFLPDRSEQIEQCKRSANVDREVFMIRQGIMAGHAEMVGKNVRVNARSELHCIEYRFP